MLHLMMKPEYRTLFGVYLKGHILSELVVELVNLTESGEFISVNHRHEVSTLSHSFLSDSNTNESNHSFDSIHNESKNAHIIPRFSQRLNLHWRQN